MFFVFDHIAFCLKRNFDFCCHVINVWMFCFIANGRMSKHLYSSGRAMHEGTYHRHYEVPRFLYVCVIMSVSFDFSFSCEYSCADPQYDWKPNIVVSNNSVPNEPPNTTSRITASNIITTSPGNIPSSAVIFNLTSGSGSFSALIVISQTCSTSQNPKSASTMTNTLSKSANTNHKPLRPK